MRSQRRAEARIALIYLLSIPGVMIAAVILEVAVLDSTSSPTLSYTHELLLHTVPAFVAGTVLFMVIALGAHQEPTDEMPPRWPLRAAPLLLSAGVPTALGGWLVLVEGHSKLNGLIVLPALILWGGVAGEWTAHRWLAHGRPAYTLSGVRSLVLDS